MQLYIRRILLIASYVAFAIIAPLIVLYAMGYRGKLIGVVLIEAYPKKAAVQVNGKMYGTLPRSIPNLIPGQATIRVTKDGYAPWEKRIEIQPGTATDLRSIKLIPSTPDRDSIVHNSRVFALSPSSSLIANVDAANKLQIHDETGLEITPAISMSQTPIALSWSPDSAYLLASFPKQTYEIFHVQEKSILKINKTIPSGNTQVSWNPTEPSTMFFLTPKHSLVSYNVASGTSESIEQSVNAYTVSNRTIYMQTLENALISKRIGTTNKTQLIPDTEKGIQKIIPSHNEYTALLFNDGELQLVSKQKEIHHIAFGVHQAIWSPSGDTLLIQSSNEELNTYTPDGITLDTIPVGELHLIVRLSRPVNPIGWLPDNKHIIYETDGNIIVSEIDTRDHAITATVQEASLTNPNIFIEQSGKSFISLQKDGTTQSLIRTWLVTKEDR